MYTRTEEKFFPRLPSRKQYILARFPAFTAQLLSNATSQFAMCASFFFHLARSLQRPSTKDTLLLYRVSESPMYSLRTINYAAGQENIIFRVIDGICVTRWSLTLGSILAFKI